MIKSLIFIFFTFLYCATFRSYFNTFYNAKKYYREAEKKFYQNKRKVTSDVRALYDKSLEKFLRVIKYFPDSPFLEDAIFYSGMIYIRLDDKLNAIKKYEELVKYFPKSTFTAFFSDSILFYLLLKKDLENYLYVLTLYPLKKSQNFYFFKAKLFEIKEDYDSSFFYAKKVLRTGSPFWREKALSVYIKSALKIGMLDSALNFKSDLEKRKELTLLLAEVYIKSGELEKAKEILKNFDSENKNYESVKLLKEIYSKEKNTLGTKRVLKNFLLKGEDYLKRQELGFELANIYFEEDSLQNLKDILNEIRKISPSTDFGRKSNVWFSLIESEEKLKNIDGDILKRELLRIGESYYVDVGLYKKAIEILEDYVKRFPNEKETPRVLYLIVFICKNFLNDKNKIESYYKILETKYKGSFYHVIARNLLEKN
ncbi:MAG: tetratricopeptide repeat protein [Candidatus Hydrothermales bacterium]